MRERNTAGLGCFALLTMYLLPLAVYWAIGILAFQNAIFKMFGRDIPWYVDAVGGLFLGWASVIATIVLWILGFVGYHFPLWP